MSDDNLIDMIAKVREQRGELLDRLTENHNHFLELMTAIIPALNMDGRPMVDVGWKHVVHRAMEWRKMLASQQAILDMAIQALDNGTQVEDVKALLGIQRENLDRVLDIWKPVP